METTIAWLLSWISAYGVFALFGLLAIGILGVPIPEDILMTLCGVLIAKQKLLLFPTIVAAVLGSFTGITVSYLIGRTFGYYLLIKYGKWVRLQEHHIQIAHEWFEKYGKWTLFFGYFLPGVRHIIGYVAGAAKLTPKRFCIYAYTGAIFWITILLNAGYFFGMRLESVLESVEGHEWVVLILIALFIGLFVLWQKRKKRY